MPIIVTAIVVVVLFVIGYAISRVVRRRWQSKHHELQQNHTIREVLESQGVEVRSLPTPGTTRKPSGNADKRKQARKRAAQSRRVNRKKR